VVAAPPRSRWRQKPDSSIALMVHDNASLDLDVKPAAHEPFSAMAVHLFWDIREYLQQPAGGGVAAGDGPSTVS